MTSVFEDSPFDGHQRVSSLARLSMSSIKQVDKLLIPFVFRGFLLADVFVYSSGRFTDSHRSSFASETPCAFAYILWKYVGTCQLIVERQEWISPKTVAHFKQDRNESLLNKGSLNQPNLSC